MTLKEKTRAVNLLAKLPPTLALSFLSILRMLSMYIFVSLTYFSLSALIVGGAGVSCRVSHCHCVSSLICLLYNQSQKNIKYLTICCDRLDEYFLP